jgi:hypothetical protein
MYKKKEKSYKIEKIRVNNSMTTIETIINN